MNAIQHDMTPEQRMAQGRCPECGKDLSHTNVIGHRDEHYPKEQTRKTLTGQAKVRFDMLTKYTQ